MNELRLFEYRNNTVVSSRIIAEKFERNHRDILKSVRELVEGMRKSSHTPEKYFIYSEYTHGQNNQIYPEYFCTRDGFSLLVMGFTGSKALEWKLKYIEAFNRMEAFIKERQSTEWLVTRKQGKMVRRNETDYIALLIDYAKEQGSKNMEKSAYTVYSKLVNALVGIEAGQWTDVNKVDRKKCERIKNLS